jgi:gamma-glutamyltranspeptidase/glutathione hydrolase
VSKNHFVAFVATLALLLVPACRPCAAAPERPGRAAIASAHTLATQAGFEALAAGGNAFDAAVAVAATLAVVEPQSSGIGGGGLFLLHRAADGKEVMVDARETAPAAVDARQYLDANGKLDQDKSWNGPLAAAIPGEPAGLVWLARHYGRLPLATSLAPAIRIAREGFQPDARFLGELAHRAEVIRRYPAAAALLLDHGEVPKPGWTLRSPDLARTLERIAAQGEEGFYQGELAQTLVAGVNAAGGHWSLADLAGYRVKERAPLAFDYRGWRIVTAAPPSSGGVLLAEMLNVLGGYDLAKVDAAHRLHLVVEAMRLAYRDRAEYLGDPDYVAMPIARLTSAAYAAKLRTFIRPDRATPSASLPDYRKPGAAPHESVHTTHFSIIDADGNLVSATQTVNLPFGNGMVVAGTGFLLNNEMDDFALQAGTPNAFGLVGNDANAPKPGHRPLSSMTPTFVIGADRVGVLGTPGGSRIITMVLEGILAFIDGELPQAIVARPRFHHQYLPDVISTEPHAFTAEETRALEKMGYVVNAGERTWGFMNMVSWNRKTGELHAASDPRGASGSGVVK